jgi:Raf kinase inhibitor-like YbhB/YbcL family protein
LAVLMALGALTNGCGGVSEPETPPSGGAMRLTSSAFAEGGLIPARYSCDGEDISPPLAWEGVPAGAQALALICEDPDAPAGVWTHWVLTDLPLTPAGLPEALPPDPQPPTGGVHGINSWRKLGYGGPCPPSGVHRYIFKLYALDAPLALGQRASLRDVQSAMQGHILDSAQLMGRYGRR